MIVQTTKAEQDASVAATLAEQKLTVAQTQTSGGERQGLGDRRQGPGRCRPSSATTTGQSFPACHRGSRRSTAMGRHWRRTSSWASSLPGFRSILTNSDGPLMELFAPVHQGFEGASSCFAQPIDFGHGRCRPVVPPSCPSSPLTLLGAHQAMNSSNLSRFAKVVGGLVALYLVGYIGIWQWGILPGRSPAGDELEAPLSRSVPLRTGNGG